MMKIRNREITENDLFFWVEEGQASHGDIKIAKEFIKTAANIKVDAIEFQLAIAEEFYIKSHPMYNYYKDIQYSPEQIIELIDYTHENELIFIAAVLAPSLIPFLTKNGCDAFVINASDINNSAIIELIIDSKLPFFICLPLATNEEIDWIIKFCYSRGAKNFVLMHGQHTMASGDSGVKIEDTNLGFIETLKQEYSQMVGFIDHSRNIFMPSIARVAGANYISKHLFLKKNTVGPDWFVCLDPLDMKVSVECARATNISLFRKEKELAEGEDMDKKIMRRSVVAACDIAANTIIDKSMFVFKRPGSGIPPSEYQIFIGKRALVDIKEDNLLTSLNIDLS